jgi:hypothetical protein
MFGKRPRNRSFVRHHSLSIASILITTLWIVLYSFSDPSTHLGSFFGNAIADWTGVVVTVLATKFMYEIGSAESRKVHPGNLSRAKEFLRDHSLSIFLLVTGIGWVLAFRASNPESRWGQVVGNVLSEWTQIFGLVILTKKLIEVHSKESRR